MPDEDKDIENQGPISDDALDGISDGIMDDEETDDEIDRGFLTDADEDEVV